MTGQRYPPDRRTWLKDLIVCGTTFALIWIACLIRWPVRTLRDTRRMLSLDFVSKIEWEDDQRRDLQ